jgi:membrane-associated phospholipid phosphatase
MQGSPSRPVLIPVLLFLAAKPVLCQARVADQAGPVAPAVSWKNLPRYLLEDQKAIWSSPFHVSRPAVKWWVIFGGITAGLIATDERMSKQLPNTKSQMSVAGWTSKPGAIYSLIPIDAAFYLLGARMHDARLRETGILGAEALAGALVADTIIKSATQRQRPVEGNGEGSFWHGAGRFWNQGSSFPSGHAIETWSLASVVAHEYPHPRWIPVLAYGVATTVSASRFAARKHFPSDVVAGAAMGWFTGTYVYRRRHDSSLDASDSRFHRFLAHVHIGGLQ